MKTNLSSYNNTWYKPQIGASTLKQFVWYFTNVIFFINPLNPFSKLKVELLKLFGAKIGNGVLIKPGVNIKYPWKLIIGDYSWIGEGVWIDNLADTTIGKNVCISQGAMLLCGNHDFTKTSFDLFVKPIIIQDGAWIGAKCIVCPGVVVGAHAVLTVNSVATGHLNAFGVYRGNPAIYFKERKIES